VRRKLIFGLVVLSLLSIDAEGARRGGLGSRWLARRVARTSSSADTYSTPQAAWNAYYSAMVRQDWDAAYSALDRQSRRHAVAGAAFSVLWFSSEDGRAGVAENLARRHRISIEAMIREIRDFNAAQESRLSGPDETAISFDDRESQALIKMQSTLLRHIPDHAAFYRNAMTALLAIAEEDAAEATQQARTDGELPPKLTEVRYRGNRAQALYRTDAALVRGSDSPGERTIDFTFEDGGWKVHEVG
jgi:hypothetical protein